MLYDNVCTPLGMRSINCLFCPLKIFESYICIDVSIACKVGFIAIDNTEKGEIECESHLIKTFAIKLLSLFQII